MIIKNLRHACSVICILLLCSCTSRVDFSPRSIFYWPSWTKYTVRHVVRHGETLYSISFRYDQDYRSVARMNHIYPPYTLRVGQVLRVGLSAHPRHGWPRRQPSVLMTRSPYKKARHGSWLWPAQGRIVTTFAPQQGKKGIDIAGRQGDKIHAAANGVVAYAGSGLLGYDYLIIIKHNQQYLTAYGHNLRNLVKEGQSVHAGQIIADMGRVERRYWGVHFEIRHAGHPMNPLEYLWP